MKHPKELVARRNRVNWTAEHVRTFSLSSYSSPHGRSDLGKSSVVKTNTVLSDPGLMRAVHSVEGLQIPEATFKDHSSDISGLPSLGRRGWTSLTWWQMRDAKITT
jgi:hypothetical protein